MAVMLVVITATTFKKIGLINRTTPRQWKYRTGIGYGRGDDRKEE
jgi:hypothetical protein